MRLLLITVGSRGDAEPYQVPEVEQGDVMACSIRLRAFQGVSYVPNSQLSEAVGVVAELHSSNLTSYSGSHSYILPARWFHRSCGVDLHIL